jgi:hypothetical protein
MFMRKNRANTEGAMLLRNLFLPTECTYIKQEGTASVYDITNYKITSIIFCYIFTVHLGTIKVYYSPTNAQVIVIKTILKFVLK